MSLTTSFCKWISRWLGRARASKSVLTILFWGMTALSTFTNVARDYLTFEQMLYIDLTIIGAVVVFMYVGDVMNFFVSQQRDLQDIQNNFLSPQGAMVQLIRAEQMKVLGEYVNGDLTEEEFKEKIDRKTKEMVKRYRRGIDADEPR